MNNVEKLFERIRVIHLDCMKICKSVLGEYLPVAGNIGVFCQSDDEYELFEQVKQTITLPSSNPQQKYFELKDLLTVEGIENVPARTYTHLYIRKPDPTSYGKYLGDMDFVLEPDKYFELKTKVMNNLVPGAIIYDRENWDTIEMTNTEFNTVSYVSTQAFAEKVRVRF
ncbi:hypothetical protein KC614_04895 [candidate division WWE3 bacterium]|uniref:Uncharacterized protein n=1 Tax=candidate division WWE3 bacterium TaxID=2053526 RepID=A0A955RR90_UNCKA|nr:hypothetical protein [candidate division WWE3 bacterium]